jgi:hypothetical protein
VVTYIAGYGMPTQQDKFASPYAGAPPVQPYQPYGAVPPPVASPAPAFGQPPAAAWGEAPATSTTPPGWQPDPTGRNQYRYWDGNAWSAHVSNAGVQATDPVSSTGPT